MDKYQACCSNCKNCPQPSYDDPIAVCKYVDKCRHYDSVGNVVLLDYWERDERSKRSMKNEPRQYSVEELKEIWTEFEKEWHMSPGYHLCAEDVTRFLDFLDKWEDRKNRKHGIAVKSVRSFWGV